MTENTYPHQADALAKQVDIAPFSGLAPLVLPIPKCVRAGNTFFVKGVTPTGANRISVNLQCGPEPGDKSDIAFHIDFRFNYCSQTNYVVCNTFKGSWGTQEIHNSMPLIIGQRFDVVISCAENHFKVTVNGEHLIDYKYRMPLSRISHLSVLKDGMPTEVYFEQPDTKCGEHNQEIKIKSSANYWEAPKDWVTVMPLIRPILVPVGPGVSFNVQGVAPSGATRFSVNLQCGLTYDKNIEVAFHLDFRFDFGENHNVVVRNSRVNSWSTEERDGGMPLTKEKPFDILIVCQESCFKVVVDGKHFTNFTHRLNVKNITHLVVFGDVMLSYADYQPRKMAG